MEFTKENWENAPKRARLEWHYTNSSWTPVHFIGYLLSGSPVVEDKGYIRVVDSGDLRIILPKRKVTVQLWQSSKAKSLATKILGVDTWDAAYNSWIFLGEHTFEIEGE